MFGFTFHLLKPLFWAAPRGFPSGVDEEIVGGLTAHVSYNVCLRGRISD